MQTPDVTTEEFLEAISEGVYRAMWRMITHATSMPCADFYDTVQSAVKAGIENAAASGSFDDVAAEHMANSSANNDQQTREASMG